MYQPSQAWKYISARRPLTTFGTSCILTFLMYFSRDNGDIDCLHDCQRDHLYDEFQ
jgi:hypothetical protein